MRCSLWCSLSEADPCFCYQDGSPRRPEKAQRGLKLHVRQLEAGAQLAFSALFTAQRQDTLLAYLHAMQSALFAAGSNAGLQLPLTAPFSSWLSRQMLSPQCTSCRESWVLHGWASPSCTRTSSTSSLPRCDAWFPGGWTCLKRRLVDGSKCTGQPTPHDLHALTRAHSVSCGPAHLG